jgi:hypothetical protein
MVVLDAIGAVDPGGDGLDLLFESGRIGIEERNSLGSWAASMTASASSAAPRPPSWKCVQTDERTPRLSAISRTTRCSEG